MPKIAIVTGADGFIGHCLTKHLLQKNYIVYAIGINKEKLLDIQNNNLHFIRAFFEDYKTLPTLIKEPVIDVFFHFAWDGVFGNSFQNYELQLKNCKYACDALMIAKEMNCKKFILASTINVLETRANFDKINVQLRYTNIYSMSKLTAEMICKTLAYQNNIEFNCGLISMVYGENNKSMMLPNVIIKNLLLNQESNLVDRNLPYDLIYVEDVADAFIAIGEFGINQKTYYVGHSYLSTFGEIVEKIKNILNPNAKINYGTYPSTNAIDYSLINLEELYNDTGFQPTSDFNLAILNTAAWLKKELEKK